MRLSASRQVNSSAFFYCFSSLIVSSCSSVFGVGTCWGVCCRSTENRYKQSNTPYHLFKGFGRLEIEIIRIISHLCNKVSNKEETVKEKKDLEKGDEEEEDEEEDAVPGSTLFIKNLSFITTEEKLQEVR